MINHADMVATLAKDGAIINAELTDTDAHLLHMAVGLQGEAAELIEAYDVAHTLGLDVDRENLIEELGDAEFYIEGLRQGLNIERCRTLPEVEELTKVFNMNEPTAEWAAVKFNITAGAVLDLVKKVVVYRKDVSTESFIEALTKVEAVLALYRTIENITYQEALDANISKLGKRYEGFKYSDNAAQVRADKTE